MKIFIGIIVIIFCFLFFSCSPAPQPMGHPFSHQKKLEAAHHWEILAKDFALQIATTLKQAPLILNKSDFGNASKNESETSDAGLSLTMPYIYRAYA
jgi:hypothetical protein